MRRLRLVLGFVVMAVVLAQLPRGLAGKDGGIVVDKDKRTITIDCKIAPRKLPNLDKVYPLEVIACWPHPKGKKAHETIVTFEVKPSEVHKALESLGLKPGAPVMGESKNEPAGPALKVYLEFADESGAPKKISIDKAMVDSRNGKPFPKTVEWRFTGSVQTQPDPNKADKVYGADESGTLMVIFPVSNQTVMQTNLTMEFERFMKLETNPKTLPKEGTPVKLILEAASK